MACSSQLEELLMCHRQERKDLLVLTQKMKHSIPKGDKKKKKDVMAEITVLLNDLDVKQDKEQKQLEDHCSLVTNNSEETAAEASTEEVNKTNNDLEEFSKATQKLSKAQKRRNKKAEQGKAREIAIAEQEIENLSSARSLEAQEIRKKLIEKNLVLCEVPPDGNCLFKAIEHQLVIHNAEEMSAEALREATSNYLISHKEEYQPFLVNTQTNDMYTDSEYMVYCEKMKDPSIWGGQVEIQALASICGRPIEIVQAYGSNIIAGKETSNTNSKLVISYHRHEFGLGAHYNSTQPNKSDSCQ